MRLRSFQLQLPAKFWHCEIPGEPRPWKRVGFGKSGYSYNPSKPEQQNIAWIVRACWIDLRCDEEHKWGARMIFYSEKLANADGDNLSKNIMDALQGVVWENDRQVRECYWIVIPRSRPRTELLVYPVSEDYIAGRGEKL